jgi:prefoldin subunit 5
MIQVYKENKRLKEEMEELQVRYDRLRNADRREQFNFSYYNGRIDELEKEINKLKKELTELYEKNYELAKKLNKE